MEAARLMVPRQGDPHGPLPPLLLVLTLVAGLVDAFSYLCLGQVLVANMTGNVVLLGFAAAGTKGLTWWALLLAVGTFLIGAWICGRLVARFGSHRGRLLFVATSLEAAMLTGAATVGLVASSPYEAITLATLVGLLGIGLGMQNAAARFLRVPDLTTSVLTLTITGMAADTAARTGTQWGRRAVPVLTLFLGACGGAVLIAHNQGPLVLICCAVLTASVAAAAGFTVRSTAHWTLESLTTAEKAARNG